MERDRDYPRVWFDVPSIQKVVSELQRIVKNPGETRFRSLAVQKKDESWNYDTLEEFLTQMRQDVTSANMSISNEEVSFSLSNRRPSKYSSTSVRITSASREKILQLATVIDACADDCFVPAPPEPERVPPKPKIFIGHGDSPQWRDLKDHLKEQQGYDVTSYETGARAGHAIRDVIEQLLETSSFAILVMTGEDTMEDGSVRARQNVVHEIGLFQGKLGFTKAIVLKEDGTEEFSNIHGVNQIRYSADNIKETFGEVLSVLRREFGERR